MLVTDTIRLLSEGYAFLPNRRRASGTDVVSFGLAGRRAVAGLGPDWARQVYDERYVERATALPGLVRNTLIGDRAVHTLDGADHRHRKQFFLQSLDAEGTRSLARAVLESWELAESRWHQAGRVVVFDEAATVLHQAVWGWCGLPAADPVSGSADMVAMVDAFGAVGPRNLRGRRARKRQEAGLVRLVEQVRAGRRDAAYGSVFHTAAWMRDRQGELLDARVAAVEILNLVRPTVAVAWFLAFAAHALHRWPHRADGLADADPEVARCFAHEVRRFYPFAPFIGGTATVSADWAGVPVEQGDLVLLDIYGQDHDARLWDEPYRFDPARFAGHQPGPYELVPQGAGDPEHGHRCPGEPSVVAMLEALLPRLARLGSAVPDQDDRIPLSRVPTRPRSGMVLDVSAR